MTVRLSGGREERERREKGKHVFNQTSPFFPEPVASRLCVAHYCLNCEKKRKESLCLFCKRISVSHFLNLILAALNAAFIVNFSDFST